MKSVLSIVGRCVLAGSLVLLVGCGENGRGGLVSPGDSLSSASAFPDSVTRSMGLPPAAVVSQGSVPPFDFHASGDFSGLVAHATSEITDAGPRILRATMWVVNPGSQPVNVAYGSCSSGVLLFAAGRTVPAWQSGYAKDPRYEQAPSCTLALHGRTIPSGDSARFDSAYPMYEVVNDTLPARTYDVRVSQRIAPWTPGGSISERTFDAPAGKLAMTRSPDPLPLTHLADSLSYVATTRRVRDSTGLDLLRALVLVTNRSSTRRYATYYGTCPITLGAFRSRADRDSVPEVPTVVYLTAGCGDSAPRSFTLEPGASWVFGNDIPVASLNGRYRAGHYWFVAGFAGLRLSANDVDTR